MSTLRIAGFAGALVLTFCVPALASDVPGSPKDSPAHLHALAGDPIWLKLLHFPVGEQRSEIVSPDFFLSPSGSTDPMAELLATIAAYDSPWSVNPNEHPRCRFPARYYWLAARQVLPGEDPFDHRCYNLSKWAGPNLPESVSVIFVGGYLGNPASMFGHSILKFGQVSAPTIVPLFDHTLGFGAIVPSHENPVLYMVRGLFGGYKSTFLDRYYFLQDLIYSKVESRDMWEYELNLTQHEKAMFVLHAWELIGRFFNYYFLSDNCGFRIAELLDLAITEPVAQGARLWYMPVETFYAIVAIDDSRRSESKPGLLNSIRYIPSQQRVLDHQFSKLNSAELSAAEEIIRDGTDAIGAKTGNFPVEARISIVNVLLAYYAYIKIAALPAEDPATNKHLDAALLERLKLPSAPGDIPDLPPTVAPTESPRPSRVAIGYVATNGEAPGNYNVLRYSPYAYDVLPAQSLGGDKFVLLDMEAGYDRKGGAYLDRATLVEVRSLGARLRREPRAISTPWQLFARTRRRQEKMGEIYYESVVRGGTGFSHKFGDWVWAYGMVDIALYSQAPALRLEPNAGLQMDQGDFTIAAAVRGSTLGQPTSELALEYRFTRDANLRIEVDSEQSNTVRAYLAYRY